VSTNSQVQIDIVARDRASPVLSRVGRNMGLLQRSAGTVAAQMTGLGGTAGTAARSIGLLGLGLGPVGIAFTALGIGAGLAARRIGEYQKAQVATKTATNTLRNSLILSGFSANNANAAVQELKTSFNAVSFQAIPRMTWELQRLLLMMGDDARKRTEDMKDTLVALGVDPVTAMSALTAAMSGDFTLINQILTAVGGTAVSTQEEFSASMLRIRDDARASTDPIIAALLAWERGEIDFAEADRRMREAVQSGAANRNDTFGKSAGIIKDILSRMTEEEKKQLLDSATNWTTRNINDVAYRSKFVGEMAKIIVAQIAVGPSAAATTDKLVAEYTRAAAGAEHMAARIEAAWARVREAEMAALIESEQMARLRATQFSEALPRGRAVGALGFIGGLPVEGPVQPGAAPIGGGVGVGAQQVGRAVGALGFIGGLPVEGPVQSPEGISQQTSDMNTAQNARDDAEARSIADAEGWGSVFDFAHGGMVPGPLGSPMPAIVHGGETVTPGGGGAGTLTIVNQIGDQVLDTLVVDVLNRTVRRVDPRLGLG